MTNLPPADLPQMDSPQLEASPPPPAVMPPPVAPPPAKQPSKLRTYVSMGVLVLIIGGILYAVRNNADAGSLTVGTCFDRPTAGQDFSTVEKHECTEAHDAEVIHVAEYTGDTLPISLTLDRYIDETCLPAVEAYTGKAAEDLGDYQLGLFSPNRDGWDDGERTFTCYILRADEGKMTQSMKGGAGS